jgi:hypothetical protein
MNDGRAAPEESLAEYRNTRSVQPVGVVKAKETAGVLVAAAEPTS